MFSGYAGPCERRRPKIGFGHPPGRGKRRKGRASSHRIVKGSHPLLPFPGPSQTQQQSFPKQYPSLASCAPPTLTSSLNFLSSRRAVPPSPPVPYTQKPPDQTTSARSPGPIHFDAQKDALRRSRCCRWTGCCCRFSLCSVFDHLGCKPPPKDLGARAVW